MAWTPTYFSFVAFLSSGIFAILIVVGWRRRWTESAPAFVALMAAAFAWAFIYGIQLGFTTQATQAVWQRATLSVSAFIPPAFLLFVLRYSGWDTWLTRRRAGLLLGEATLFGAFAWTNPFHGLVWSSATLHPRSVSPALDVAFGPVYYAHILVAYLTVLVGIGVLLVIFFQRESVSHNQAGLLVLGAGPALITHGLYTLKLSPRPGLDLTPFLFVMTGVVYGLALFHFDLLERIPIAQQRALEIMGDGLLVVDDQSRLVDANDVARRALDVPDVTDVDITDVFGVEEVEDVDGQTRTVIDDGVRRAYDVHVSELTDQHGSLTGHAVVLRDVTDRFGYEERLEVTNRVLRHNLRNDMNVIEGFARLLEGQVDSTEHAQYARNIRQKAEELSELSEKARQMIAIEVYRTTGHPPPDAVEIVEDLVSGLRKDHPAVRIVLRTTDRAPVATVSHHALQLAIRNLLENSIRHNPGEDPELFVTVERIADRVHVSVEDNGPGLPAMERDVLRSTTQTPLHHSQGLGLWLTYWIVDTAGGEVDLASTSEEGTRISLLLRAAEAAEE